jgi:sugar phosphate isomerase/epimerase
MNLKENLGVKGYCFRGYPENATVAAKVKECGLDRIDLSGCQLDFKDAAQHQPAIDAYQEASVHIIGIGVVTFAGDEAGETQYFEFGRKAGCNTISCNFAPDSMDESLAYVERLCSRYDMRAAIHNHGGKHWLGNSTMLAHYLKKSSSRIGLCIDTAWCIQAGEDPVRWLEQFSGRVHAVHYKDFVFEPNGQVRDTIVGQGALNLKAFVQGLKAINFDGPAVVEYEGDVENPVPALQKCVQAMLPFLG